jgi:hypothetical protein
MPATASLINMCIVGPFKCVGIVMARSLFVFPSGLPLQPQYLEVNFICACYLKTACGPALKSKKGALKRKRKRRLAVGSPLPKLNIWKAREPEGNSDTLLQAKEQNPSGLQKDAGPEGQQRAAGKRRK